MELTKIIFVFILLAFAEELLGTPLKFPEDTSVGQAREADTGEESEPRFHHHRKKKKKKHHGCRFKRAERGEGRFFFPILNYYDTDIYVNGGPGGGGSGQSGCGSGLGGGHPGLGGGVGNVGSGLGSGLGGLGSGLGGGLGGIGSGLGSGVQNIGSGLGGGVQNIGSGLGGGFGNLGSGLGSITSGLPSIGSGIPPLLGGTNNPSSSFPSYTTRPPVITQPQTSKPPAPVSTLDPDNEDYDYSDFSTTTRTRPIRPYSGSALSDYPILNSINNGIRRPQGVFNQYVVKPINKTIREFYSLF